MKNAQDDASVKEAAKPAAKKTLNEILADNNDLYTSLHSLVRDIKEFENKNYGNFTDFAKRFGSDLAGYMKQKPLSADRTLMEGYLTGLNFLFNDKDLDVEKKKAYVQRIINSIYPILDVEYGKIKGSLSAEDYRSMVKGSLSDPNIMINPFADSLRQELGKNENFGRTVKFTQLADEMGKDFKNGNFSRLGEYFEKIPYDMDAYRKTGLKDADIYKMRKDMDGIFKDAVSDLKEENRKMLMGSFVNILEGESSKHLDNIDSNYSMNAFGAVNPGAVNGLYLALNSGNYGRGAMSQKKMDPAMLANMLGSGNQYDMTGGMDL